MARESQAEYLRAWRAAHPDWKRKHREYQRGYMAARRAAETPAARAKRLAGMREYQRRRAVTARPASAPRAELAGLVTVRTRDGWQRISGWREDEAQDRLLAELERQAGGAR